MVLKGTKQSSEHIRRRIESVAKTKALWTDEQHESFSNKIREIAENRSLEQRKGFMFANVGREPWCKGKKCPQLSGKNHWNWGGKMSQESIEKMRRSLTGMKQSPELIAKRVSSRAGYRHSEETKKRIGEANSNERNGMFGKNGSLNPTWKGGTSFDPYPTSWTFRLREMIRNRDGRKCLVCGIGENGLRHDVHHIDYDKRNIVPENLVTLCHSCHMKTIYNREPWKAFFLARRINKCLQKN